MKKDKSAQDPAIVFFQNTTIYNPPGGDYQIKNNLLKSLHTKMFPLPS